MTFAHPVYVAAGLAAAVAFLLLAWASERRSRRAAVAYSNLAFLEAVAGTSLPWTGVFACAWALAIATAGAALAKPGVVTTVPVRDASIVLCIDTSGSMASTDVLPTRSAAARTAAGAFIDGTPPGTRIGIVAFSSAAIPLGALTSDKDVAREELGRLPAPNGGTAIGDALVEAAKLLPPAGRRAIVLVTDGVNNSGSDPIEDASIVGARAIALFTVGIGTSGSGQIIPGTAEEADLDEEALREIASIGHGTYARVADAGALRDRLSTIAQTSIKERRRVDLTLPFAVGGGVLALGAVLGALVVGRFP